jgi:peptidoglycan hydrolase-like protein with peptidoglycan-binding domain
MGYYRDIVDGLPGPATEEALLTYQRSQRMTLTGRLDLPTLAELRLLPNTGRPSGPPAEARGQRTYRGVWINKGPLRFGVEFR